MQQTFLTGLDDAFAAILKYETPDKKARKELTKQRIAKFRAYARKIGRRMLFFKQWNQGAKEKVMKRKGISIINKEINFYNISADYYNSLPFGPCIDMLPPLCPENLSKNLRLQVKIPVTIVFHKRQVYWLYTDKSGRINNRDLLDDWQGDAYKAITGEVFNYEHTCHKPVAVIKSPDWGNPQKNTTRILRDKDLDEMLHEGGERLCIQQYIPSRGNASFTRLVYHPGTPITGWSVCKVKPPSDKIQDLLNNPYGMTGMESEIKTLLNDAFLISTDQPDSIHERVIPEPAEYLRRIVKHMSKYAFPGLSIKFTEYVADFIIDSNGVWWFIQTKAFQISEESKNQIMYYQKSLEEAQREHGEYADVRDNEDHRPIEVRGMSPREKQIYLTKKCFPQGKVCVFCGVRYQDDRKVVDSIGNNLSVLVPEFGYTVSYHMLDTTLKHLKKRGCSSDIFDLFIGKTKKCKPYENLKICKLCYDLYTKTQQLIMVEKKLVSFLGIDIKSNHLPSYPSSAIVDRDELKADVKQYRIMIFVHELYTLNAERHQYLLQSLDSSPFEVIYYILNRPYHFTYYLNPSDKGTYPIRHVKLFYLFARQFDIFKIIKDNIFRIEIWQQGEKIAVSSCKLDRLCQPGVESDDGKKISISLYLSTKVIGDMGIKLSLCLKQDDKINPPEKSKFCYINGLYYPNDNYYDSSAIPDSWISAVAKDPRSTGITNIKDKVYNEVPYINVPHSFTYKSFVGGIQDTPERRKKRKILFRRIFTLVTGDSNKLIVDCALLKHCITVQSSEIPKQDNPTALVNRDPDPYLTYHICMLLNYDPIIRERLQPYDLKGKGEIEWKEFYALAEGAITNASIGGNYNGECIRYCKIHGSCPHYSCDLYCMICNQEKKPVQTFTYEKSNYNNLEDNSNNSETTAEDKIDLDKIIGGQNKPGRTYHKYGYSAYKVYPKPPKSKIRPATSRSYYKRPSTLIDRNNKSTRIRSAEPDQYRARKRNGRRYSSTSSSVKSYDSDLDDFINAQKALLSMKNTTKENSSTTITEKEQNPEWNIIPLSPIISPERENKFENRNNDELNALSDFESDDEIELSGTNNNKNNSENENDNDNEFVINRISEINNNNNEEEEEKDKEKEEKEKQSSYDNFEDEFEKESNNENETQKEEEGKEEVEEEEEEEEVLFEVNSNSNDNFEKDMSLFTKLSPRRQDLINTANRNILFLYVQYDKVKKVENLFKSNKIQIESLDESRNDLTLMQLAIKNESTDMINLLYKNCISPFTKNNKSVDSYEYANMNSTKEINKFLNQLNK